MQHRRQPRQRVLFFIRASLLLLLFIPVVPSAAMSVPLSLGDVVAAYNGDGENFLVYHYDAQGNQLAPAVVASENFATGVAVDDRGRVIVSTDRGGLLQYQPLTGTLATLNPSFSGSIQPNANGIILGRSGDTISRFDSATDTFTPVFDLSTSTTLSGVEISAFDVLNDGTILMLSADSVYRLDVGASDATLLASGGMLVEGPGIGGFDAQWTARDIAITGDQRILVATVTPTPCELCFTDLARLVEIDVSTGAQSEALAGAVAQFPGSGTLDRYPIAAGDGRVYVGRGDVQAGGLEGEIDLLRPNGSGTNFVHENAVLAGLAVSFVPEPSTALLTAVGLVGLTALRRWSSARRH